MLKVKTAWSFGIIWRRGEIRIHVRLPSNGFQELEIVSQKLAKVSLNLLNFPQKKPILCTFPEIIWEIARKTPKINNRFCKDNYITKTRSCQ